MGCSQPNIIAVNGNKVKFLGPRVSEDDPVWFHYHRKFGEIHDVPCGKCDLCRVTRRYERALRIMLEAESFPDSTYFITLTYDNDHLDSPALNHAHWAQFMKDFRQRFCQAQYCKWPDKRKSGKVRSVTFKSIKQVMCGEYGDHFGRRHFHGIIFGHDFSHDLVPTGTYSSRGHAIRTSKSLSETWSKGFVQVESVNMDLALYVSSYITDQALEGVRVSTPTEFDLPGGFSPKPLRAQYGRFGRGIGRSWLDKYWKDVLSAGSLILSSGSYPIPRSFFKWMEGNPDFERWKAKRRLTTEDKVLRTILKGDGPLRRARAKGRIFQRIHSKKEIDL